MDLIRVGTHLRSLNEEGKEKRREFIKRKSVFLPSSFTFEMSWGEGEKSRETDRKTELTEPEDY